MLNGGYVFNENFVIMSSVRVMFLDNFDKFNYLVDNEEVLLFCVCIWVCEYVLVNDVWLDIIFLYYKDIIVEDFYV